MRSPFRAIVGRAITLKREPSKKKQKIDTKKGAKMIKSDNCTRSIEEKSNIAIAILEKLPFLNSAFLLYQRRVQRSVRRGKCLCCFGLS